MYIPSAFQWEDREQIHQFIRTHAFASLHSEVDDQPHATHLPFLLDSSRGRHGVLRAHMAKANPHWESFTPKTKAMVLFSGPHAYISPRYYSSPDVPTWNYVTVHVYGTPRRIEDPEDLRKLVVDLVELHESGPTPWDLLQAPEEVRRGMQGIIGFEIPIERIEGKIKLNQNRSSQDRWGVVKALEYSGRAVERELAAIMRRQLEEEGHTP